MGKKVKNLPCHMKDSDYCQIIAGGKCDDCPCATMTSGEREKLMDAMDGALTLLPEGDLRHVAEGGECLFCAGESKNKKSCYGFADYAHVSADDGKEALTVKNGRKAYAVSIQIPCCENCKKNWKKIALILPICSIIGIALGLIVGLVLPVRNIIAGVHVALPLIIAVILGVSGFTIGIICKKSALKKLSRETDFTYRSIGYINKMTENGWFPVSKRTPPTPVFSKERRRQGWFV